MFRKLLTGWKSVRQGRWISLSTRRTNRRQSVLVLAPAIISLESRALLSSAGGIVNPAAAAYRVVEGPVDGGRQWQLFDSPDHQFGALVRTAGGQIGLRLHPDPLDLDGWGHTLYLAPFLNGAEPFDGRVDLVSASANGIRIAVSGSIARSGQTNYGTWQWQITLTYDSASGRVSGIGGVLDVRLNGTLGAAGRDLNLYRLASNYLDIVPLQTGGAGPTGDFARAEARYAPGGSVLDFAWAPTRAANGHFPNDASPYLSVNAVGDLNRVSTWDQGLGFQIELARKPDLRVTLASRNPGDGLSFGGLWNVDRAVDFSADNLGINALVLRNTTANTHLTFDVTLEATVPDVPFTKAYEAELASARPGTAAAAGKAWNITNYGRLAHDKSLPSGTYEVEVDARGIAEADVAPQLQIDVNGYKASAPAAIGENPLGFTKYRFSGIEINGNMREFGLRLLNDSAGRDLVIDKVLFVRTGDLPSDRAAAFARDSGLEGLYFAGGQIASVLRNGSSLTLVNPIGDSALATALDETRLVAPAWNNQTATVDRAAGTIHFSGGDVWRRVRQIDGRFITGTGLVAGVRQIGTELTFTGGTGATSLGRFLDSDRVAASDWGNLTGTISRQGTELRWDNGTVWRLIPDLDGAWTNTAGQPLRVEQSGTSLLFVNRQGKPSAGRLTSVGQVVASGWGNLTGTLVGQSIRWTNGDVWYRDELLGPVPDVGGLWDVSGQDTRILQNSAGLTFVNRSGGTSAGRLVSGTELIADGWGGAQGLLSGDGLDTLTWTANGNVWRKLPDLAGAFVDQNAGLETGVTQLERSLTFTDALGTASHGQLVGPTSAVETDGARRTATIVDGYLSWGQFGSVWGQVADLSGNWSVDFTNAPTYVEQSGMSLLFVNNLGKTLRGKFVSPTQARLTQSGIPNSAIINVGIMNGNRLEFDVAPSWRRTPHEALDSAFADPGFWPFV